VITSSLSFNSTELPYANGFPQYVEALYREVFDDWISENPSRVDVVARHAMATLEYKATHLPTTATFLEAWIEFQHVASADERESLRESR
jgi:hypothetical protein